MARRDPEKWRVQPAPTLTECVEDLEAAHEIVVQTGDIRLRSSVENNICLASCRLYERQPFSELRIAANAALDRLMATLYEAESDFRRWPIRIADTVVVSNLTLNDSIKDTQFLEHLVETLERRYKAEMAEDEKELMAASLKQYRSALTELRADG